MDRTFSLLSNPAFVFVNTMLVSVIIVCILWMSHAIKYKRNGAHNTEAINKMNIIVYTMPIVMLIVIALLFFYNYSKFK